MDVSVNYLAVFLAAAASMVVGSIWYSQGVFGKAWGKLAHVDMSKPTKAGDMVWLMTSTFVATLFTAYILAHVAFLSNQFFKNEFIQDALSTAFWLWFGLVAARIYVHDSFEGRRKKLTILTFGHELIILLVMALIIGGMGYPGI